MACFFASLLNIHIFITAIFIFIMYVLGVCMSCMYDVCMYVCMCIVVCRSREDFKKEH